MALKPDQWDLEVDFVSIGSGLGGMTAAIVAHDLGKKAVVLEKAPKLGGVSAYSGGEVWLPNNHKMKEAGIPDSDEEGMKYYEFLSNGYGDKAMLQRMYEAAQKALPYLEKEVGVKWRHLPDFPDYYYPHAPGTAAEGRYLEVAFFKGADLGEWQDKVFLSPISFIGISHEELFKWGGFSNIREWDFEEMAENAEKDLRGFGPGMMAFFVKAAVIDRGIPVYLETPACELVVEDGTVVGVRAEREGKDFYVRARNGVLIAIGGYDHDEKQARYWEDMPEWKSQIPPYVSGDNIMLGGDVGAALAGVSPANLACFMGFHIPGEEHEGVPLWRASTEGGAPHTIWVNREGKRFCDESFYKDFQPQCRNYDGRLMDQVNYPPILILDSNFREQYSVGTYMPGDTIPEEFACQAGTLRELAEKLEIPPDTFEATVERFNKLVDEGKDIDFGRGDYPWATKFFGDRNYPHPHMGHINKPPYYGIKLCPASVGVNAVGLKTDINGQVVNVRGQAVKGLYAAGNSAAQIDIGPGYNSGIANTRGIAWGYIAAHHAIEGK
jgi:3-oxosteroid 1-dehydrogenase